MASVYLPMGYPQLSGAEFETMVYQGQVVRFYADAVDPRTDDQLFRRHLFSDIAKMRASAGEYVKAAWKIQFGRSWGSVISQICLSDADSLWSTAWGEWDAMEQAEQDYLNENAPYGATWLAPGRVWWALYQTLYNWNVAHDENNFHMPAIVVSDPDAGWTWWSSVFESYDLQAYMDEVVWWDDRSQAFSITGTWTAWDGAGPRDGTLRQGHNVGDYLEVVRPFNVARLWYAKNTDTGTIEIYYNGEVQETIDTNGALTWQQVFDIEHVFVAEQPLRFVHGGPVGKLIDIDGVELWTVYKGEHLELAGDGWAVHADVGAALGYYDLCSSGVPSDFYFNFVGRYAVIYYPKRPDMTTHMVTVDGVPYGSFYAYAETEIQRQVYIVGPLRNTLHRVQVHSYNGKLAVDEVQVRNYKSDL